jgi:hypothetical protein
MIALRCVAVLWISAVLSFEDTRFEGSTANVTALIIELQNLTSTMQQYGIDTTYETKTILIASE